MDPFLQEKYVVSLTDYYSRWPEATVLRTVTSANILEWLDNVFATQGYPKRIKPDNATYFTSNEFKKTLTTWGIQLHLVTLYCTQANGQIERFNQVILKHVPHIEHNRKGLAKIVANDATELSYNAAPSYWRNASNDADESRNSYQTTDREVQ
mgnify:CR=1 FL=1